MNTKYKLEILWPLLIIPFIKPFSFVQNQIFSSVYDIYVLLSILVIALLYFANNKPSIFISLIIFYNLTFLVSTFVNHEYISKAIFSAGRNIAICMLVESAIRRNAVMFLKKLTSFFSALTIINFALLILFPAGLFIGSRWGARINFLDTDNGLAQVMIPTMTLVLIRYFFLNDQNKKRDFTLFAICILTLLFVWSGSGIGALTIFGGYLILSKITKISKHLSAKFIVLLFIFLFVFIIILRKQEVFAFFIEDVLHKDLSFTNRTRVWDVAMKLILESTQNLRVFFLGSGIRVVNLIMSETKGLYAHSHNEIFEIILQSGLVGFLFFGAIIYVTFKKLSRYDSYQISRILTAALASFLIVSLVDTCFTIPFYIMLTISYNVDRIIDQLDLSPITYKD